MRPARARIRRSGRFRPDSAKALNSARELFCRAFAETNAALASGIQKRVVLSVYHRASPVFFARRMAILTETVFDFSIRRDSMRFRFLSSLLVVALALLASHSTASAQTTQGDGTVTLKQANGTTAPVAGATVTFYRTDIASKPITVKTGKDGRYTLVGLALTGRYTITVSAPGARPSYLANVPISQHPTNDFTLEPGDGSSLTLEQINAAGTATADSAAAKKAAEEAARRNAEIEAKNKKIGEINATVQRTFKAGNEAFNAKRYDEAIAAYNEGLQADPEQGALYLNKSVALRARGVEKYNAAVRAKDQAGKAAAIDDFKAATEAAENAVKYYRANLTTRQGTGSAGATQQPNEMLNYLGARAEAYRLALRTGTPVSSDDAVKALQEYVDAEPDPAKKAAAEASIGDALFQGGKVDEAIAAYRKILAANPNNVDAMYGLGLALAADPSGAKAAEARDMLKQFLAKAPANHPKRQEAQEAIAALDEALKPKQTETTTDAGKKRRKG
jgi:tetratricopeptide (TPR) repeat protein